MIIGLFFFFRELTSFKWRVMLKWRGRLAIEKRIVAYVLCAILKIANIHFFYFLQTQKDFFVSLLDFTVGTDEFHKKGLYSVIAIFSNHTKIRW